MQRNQVNVLNSTLKQFLSLNSKQKKYQNMYKDIKFQFKPFYITKITYYSLILYPEQLQLFIDATPVTAFHLSCRSVPPPYLVHVVIE